MKQSSIVDKLEEKNISFDDLDNWIDDSLSEVINCFNECQLEWAEKNKEFHELPNKNTSEYNRGYVQAMNDLINSTKKQRIMPKTEKVKKGMYLYHPVYKTHLEVSSVEVKENGFYEFHFNLDKYHRDYLGWPSYVYHIAGETVSAYQSSTNQ